MSSARAVRIAAGDVQLEGDLSAGDATRAVVIFAHGSGSSRHSRRNRSVAAALQNRGLGTLLMDLLTPDEERTDARTAHLRFDIPLLAERLVAACYWAESDPATRDAHIGLFGASTGGGAALIAAAAKPERVRAVVSRGGRPDLAGDALPHVRTPTLLIVGELDEEVLQLNRTAQSRMTAPVELRVVPGATHLFEEPGGLEQVSALAGEWFTRHLLGG